MQYSLTVGTYIGIASTKNLKPPFREWEVDLRYDAAVIGKNVDPIHRAGILLKFLFGKEKKEKE